MPVFVYTNATRIITIPAPKTTVTCQELLDDIRDYEDDWEALDIPGIAEASGKEDLGGGILVGITLMLIDWKVKFEDRLGPAFVKCEVGGGNLVCWDTTEEEYVNAIAPAAYVSDTRTTSASATIRELEIVNLQRLIETQRSHHAGTGNIWYWDPYNGDDGNDGKFPERATKTFAQAQILAVNHNHDVIFCYPGDPSGLTVAVENLEITKHYLFIRGPGRDFRIIPSDDTKPAVRFVPGLDGGELSGCVVESAPSGSQPAIFIDGADFVLLDNVWVDDSVAEGIKVVGGSKGILCNCTIEGCAADGVYLGDGVSELSLDNIHIEKCAGDGVNFAGAGIEGVSLIGHSEIHDNAGYGIRIGAGTSRTCLSGSELDLVRNTLGNLLDNGTDTEVCGALARQQTANAVWDEDLTAHISTGSPANILKFLKGMVGGRWQIIDAVPFPQLVHFELDGVTEIKRYDLKDKDGNAIDISKILVFDKVGA